MPSPAPSAGSSLRADALAGHTVLVTAPAVEEAPPVAPGLAAGLTGYGARLVPLRAGELPAAADLLLADLRPAADPAPAPLLTAAFLAARQARPALAAAGGAVLFLLPPAVQPAAPQAADRAALLTATGSLARSLAQEWADQGIRVNVLIDDGDPDRTADLVAYLAGPAAVMLTGQLLDLTDTTTGD